jgi:hypothetical protein
MQTTATKPTGSKNLLSRICSYQAQEVEKSPESKRKKTEIVTRMKHAPVVQSEHGLLDATNHVQRFMYTRALFARLEGTSQHQTDQIHPSNKGGATPSPDFHFVSVSTATHLGHCCIGLNLFLNECSDLWVFDQKLFLLAH